MKEQIYLALIKLEDDDKLDELYVILKRLIIDLINILNYTSNNLSFLFSKIISYELKIIIMVDSFDL